MERNKARKILPIIKQIITDADALQYEDSGPKTATIKMSTVPAQPETVVVLTQTGGPPSDRDVPVLTQTIQVYVRSNDYERAQSLLVQISDAIEGNQNLTVGEINIMDIWSTSAGGPIGRDENGLDEWTQNFIVRSRHASP